MLQKLDHINTLNEAEKNVGGENKSEDRVGAAALQKGCLRDMDKTPHLMFQILISPSALESGKLNIKPLTKRDPERSICLA